MFLKSLTLRGFKSFADKTTLEFEPGVTVVVGPNGSGKSNLVDAVAWVLGAQGPRTLRGGKMDDVIFAGTPKRTSLGRAEVSLTIDNTSGILPIEFSEVTITRTLFRDGDSEYQINNAPCRLLDIQELLSDSGIGRQQHVIVGQGQIDSVLNSRPEERRAIIEEAAGILKFRKRREKAERRLESAEANLVRLVDTMREVKRQLTPLARQADAARRHDGLADELRAIRLHLAGLELAGLQARLTRIGDQKSGFSEQEGQFTSRLRDLDVTVLEAERTLTAMSDNNLTDALAGAEALRERMRGLHALVAEKQRNIERELEATADEGVFETLVADAARLRAELAEVDESAEAVAAQLSEQPSSVPAIQQILQTQQDALHTAESAWRNAEADAQRCQSRVETIDQALARRQDNDGNALLANMSDTFGVLADQLDIEPGSETAVRAVLGDAFAAVVVRDHAAARQAIAQLKRGHANALLLITQKNDAAQSQLPTGVRALAECVTAKNPEVQSAVNELLANCVLARDWEHAVDVAVENSKITVVTPEGDRLGGQLPWRVGEFTDSGFTVATLEYARKRAAEAENRRETAEAEFLVAQAALTDAQKSYESATEAKQLQFTEQQVRAGAREERRNILSERLADIEKRLARNPEAQAAAEQQRAQFEHTSRAYFDVTQALTTKAQAADALLERFREQQRLQSAAARTSAEQLDALRTERAGLEKQLVELREHTSRNEIEEAESRMRLETLVERIRAEFDCEPELALTASAPEFPEGTTLAGRARELERELKLMGPVNPLALEEYASLQERHEFLEKQMHDVRESRRELSRVIKAIDQEIVTVFQAAFADVAQHYEQLFARLFPGGSGRVTLTNPDDLLSSGVEVEARPSGKQVRRLSLLSGGERSLAGMAFLFAVFRSRPSPFYMLDEVEAALDDINLHRFLGLIEEFRNEAQLLVVSHQKRTMEAADVLYGVTMPPGGSSRVVSQRIPGSRATVSTN